MTFWERKKPLRKVSPRLVLKPNLPRLLGFWQKISCCRMGKNMAKWSIKWCQVLRYDRLIFWYILYIGLHLHDCSSALGNDDAKVVLVTSVKSEKITRAKSSNGSSNIMHRIQHQRHCGEVSQEAWTMSTNYSYCQLNLNWNFWNSCTTSYWVQNKDVREGGFHQRALKNLKHTYRPLIHTNSNTHLNKFTEIHTNPGWKDS